MAKASVEELDKGQLDMTNERASKVIQQGLDDLSIDYTDNEQLEALEMAIRALQAQADDDLISRQAVFSAIGEWIAHREDDYTNATEYLRHRIKAIPSAEPYKGMTKGEVIKAVFPNMSIHYHKADDINDSYVSVHIKGSDTQQDYAIEWWNSPYKGVSTPSADKWIPVSERLPEEGTLVLCSVTDEKHSVVINQYNAQEYWFDSKIIAWMPLPKPYEPQERSE